MYLISPIRLHQLATYYCFIFLLPQITAWIHKDSPYFHTLKDIHTFTFTPGSFKLLDETKINSTQLKSGFHLTHRCTL